MDQLNHIHRPRRAARPNGVSARSVKLVALAALVALTACGEDEAGATGADCPLAGSACTCLDGSQGSMFCGPAGSLPQCDCLGAGVTTGSSATASAGGTSAGGGVGATTGVGGATSASASADGGSWDAGVGSGEAGVAEPATDGGMPEPDGGEEPGDGEDGSSGVPDGDHCAAVADWDPLWVQYEDEVLLLTNEVRAAGANCDTYGSYGPTGPLAMQAQLRCAARLHSVDMAENDYFAHESLDGRQPSQRMAAAGYQGNAWGENIAQGYPSPQEVVDGWVDSDGHCANLMEPGFTEIGIGFYMDPNAGPWMGGEYWTQNFGASGGGGGGGGGNICDYVQLPSCP